MTLLLSHKLLRLSVTFTLMTFWIFLETMLLKEEMGRFERHPRGLRGERDDDDDLDDVFGIFSENLTQ